MLLTGGSWWYDFWKKIFG